jgi:hypothetical protein
LHLNAGAIAAEDLAQQVLAALLPFIKI